MTLHKDLGIKIVKEEAAVFYYKLKPWKSSNKKLTYLCCHFLEIPITD